MHGSMETLPIETTQKAANKASLLDIGCGLAKYPGSYGVDCFQFPEVDKVFDLNENWPLPDSQFTGARAVQVIEHVRDTKHFLKEIHRVCKHGAEVYIETPHYSWIDSWNDPTHLWHFSSDWAVHLTKGQYLSYVVGEYQVVKTEIEFNKTLRSLIPRLIVKLLGRGAYEKHYAFLMPARNIRTTLKVIKN